MHVALWEDVEGGRITAAAVALPAPWRGATVPTHPLRRHRLPRSRPGRLRMLVSDRRPPAFAEAGGRAEIGADVCRWARPVPRRMAVVRNQADAYVHAGGQWEWESAAPVGVALASGLHRPASTARPSCAPAAPVPPRFAGVPPGAGRPPARGLGPVRVGCHLGLSRSGVNVGVGHRGRDNDQGLIKPDRLPWSAPDVLDDAVSRRRHRVLHFHGLDGNQRLAGGTAWPGCTWTASTVPGIGLVTGPLPPEAPPPGRWSPGAG